MPGLQQILQSKQIVYVLKYRAAAHWVHHIKSIYDVWPLLFSVTLSIARVVLFCVCVCVGWKEKKADRDDSMLILI